MDVATRKRLTAIDYQLAALHKRRSLITHQIAELLRNLADVDTEADGLLDERAELTGGTT